jgi:hypothetical protein
VTGTQITGTLVHAYKNNFLLSSYFFCPLYQIACTYEMAPSDQLPPSSCMMKFSQMCFHLLFLTLVFLYYYYFLNIFRQWSVVIYCIILRLLPQNYYRHVCSSHFNKGILELVLNPCGPDSMWARSFTALKVKRNILTHYSSTSVDLGA